MRNLLFLLLFVIVSCGSKTGKEFFFKVDDLKVPDVATNSVKIQKIKMYYLSNSRKDQNNLCFTIKLEDKEIKEQIDRINFKLFHEGSGFEYISMFPPSISEEETIFICFSQDYMKKTKLDSIISSMEEIRIKDKIEITKDIIRNLELYLYYDDNDSIHVTLNKDVLFSFFLRDKSMAEVY